MKKDREFVNSIKIAAPCGVSWDSMEGDERSRFCGECKLNVHNVSSMSDAEVKDLFRNANRGVCVRLFRRFDGTVITDNCPVGLRRIRDKIKLRIACLVAVLLSAGLITSAQAQGLVGAPLDPRYGLSGNVVGVMADFPNGLGGADPTTIPSYVGMGASLMWISGLLLTRKASISLISLGLAVISAVLGALTIVLSFGASL